MFYMHTLIERGNLTTWTSSSIVVPGKFLDSMLGVGRSMFDVHWFIEHPFNLN